MLHQGGSSALRTCLDGHAGALDEECADNTAQDGQHPAYNLQVGRSE